MRYSPEQLNRKRGRKKQTHTRTTGSPELAIFCKFDDVLMTPAYERIARTTKKTLIYFCQRCGNKINPLVDQAAHGMTVQTADNAIQYPGKKKTIAYTPNRSYSPKKEDEMDKFINDPLPGITDNMYATVTKRVIERKGAKRFKLKVY